jgi:hypothetical protein
LFHINSAKPPVVTFLSGGDSPGFPVCDFATDQRLRGYLSQSPEATQLLKDFFQACQALDDVKPAPLMDFVISLANIKATDSQAINYLEQCILAHSKRVFNPTADVSHARGASLTLRKLKGHSELRAKAEASNIGALYSLRMITTERLVSFLESVPRLTRKACREFVGFTTSKRGGGDHESWAGPKSTTPKSPATSPPVGESVGVDTTTPTPTPEDQMMVLDTNSALPPHIREALNAFPVPPEKIERLEEVYHAYPSFGSESPCEAPDALPGTLSELLKQGRVASKALLPASPWLPTPHAL